MLHQGYWSVPPPSFFLKTALFLGGGGGNSIKSVIQQHFMFMNFKEQCFFGSDDDFHLDEMRRAIYILDKALYRNLLDNCNCSSFCLPIYFF